MKRIDLKLGLAVCAGIVTLFGASTDVFANTHAGISKLISNCLYQTQGLVIADSDVTLSKAAPAEENEQPQADAEEKEDPTICGYMNLGIAHVDNFLNIRKTPEQSGELVGQMPKGAGCEVLEKEGDWYLVKSGAVKGYVSGEYLYTGDTAKEKAKDYIKTVATVTTETLFVREKANTDCKILALVGMDEELTVLEEDAKKGWHKVEIDDVEGYVSGDYVTIADKLPKALTISEVKYGQGVSNVRVDLVQYALQFVGNRYVWGGTSLTNGVDCSGFTMQVYRKYGISLPHSSRAQPGYGRKISASEAQPGDLFFYGSGSSIGHVAIYIGGGRVVHASNARDGIKISNAFYRSPICVVSYL